MHLYTDYIEPLTFWLQAHPHWALFFTFIVSFSESLAIIGSIIPGSITMTAIGIMAGSGLMRIDLTYLMATLGAIAGDAVSYAIGYKFSDRILNIWPFKNHPTLINYGQNYFAKHGAISVLIGRFVGPVRSIIPMIAGMMHMNHWHFLIANMLSAIGWAVLYVTPGVLIGAASSELSTESSTRLFVLILILLIIIWLTSLSIKWLVVHTTPFLRTHLHNFWTWLKEQPRLSYLTKILSPHNETTHHSTAGLMIVLIICFFASIIMITLAVQSSWVAMINNPVNLFFLSLRTQPFDTFFVLIHLIVSPLPLSVFLLSIVLYSFYNHNWRALNYWLSLILTTGIILFLLIRYIELPPINGLTKPILPPTFPDATLTLSTSFFSFFIFYIRKRYQATTMLILHVLLFILLTLAGIAVIYLGDNWLTSVITAYLIGSTVSISHWIFYRRHATLPQQQPPVMIFGLLLFVSTLFAYVLSFKKLVRTHNYHVAQYVITDQVWWNQQQPLLPIYSTNRIGQNKGLLNIQYLGSIKKLQQTLEAAGWKRQPNAFLYSLVMRAGGQHTANELPLMAQLYLNRKPELMMTFNTDNPQIFIILRLWRSNYHLRHYRQPIWLGSVTRILDSKQMSPAQGLQQLQQSISTQSYIMKVLDGFKFNQMILPNRHVLPFPTLSSPMILMIKDASSQKEPNLSNK